MNDIDPLSALADPTRRKLVERLREGPASVSQLLSAVPVSQPAVSQHLRLLKDARLVAVEKHGNRRIYRLDPQGLAALRSYVDSLWDVALGSFQQAAENVTPQEIEHENPTAR